MKSALKLNSIPMKNMRTHPVRTMILILLVIAQAACMMGGLMLTRSMRLEMAIAEARLGADILVYPSAAMSKISSKTLLMQGSPVEVWKDRSILSRIITVIAAGAWIVLLLALGIAQSMMMKERKRELYVWHAIGASRAVVNRVMLLETFFIYAAGALLGILLCAGLLPVLFGTAAEHSTLLRFALLTMLLTILIGCVSTLLSVKRATESMNGQMLLTV